MEIGWGYEDAAPASALYISLRLRAFFVLYQQGCPIHLQSLVDAPLAGVALPKRGSSKGGVKI